MFIPYNLGNYLTNYFTPSTVRCAIQWILIILLSIFYLSNPITPFNSEAISGSLSLAIKAIKWRISIAYR